MKHSYIDLLRYPDSVLFQFEDSDYRFEEPATREERKARIDYKVENGEGVITLYPTEKPLCRVKMRWRGDMSDVISVLGDALERNYDLINGDVKYGNVAAWRSIMPQMRMSWYFHAYDGARLNCFGVKTGANAICDFYCDEGGITLWLDVRCGGGGVSLKEPLVAARVVCREGSSGENPFEVSRAFCKIMCDKPVLPKNPIFGVNNWYWAYGSISHDIVMADTDNLMDMCADAVAKPYMIIDDGWQCNRRPVGEVTFIGGPWDKPNERFESMQKTADAIIEKGARPGIWFRPLLASLPVSESWKSPYQEDSRGGATLDASNPEVLEMIGRDVRRIRSWGYELIKHDFSTFDILGHDGRVDSQNHFYDRSLTNATIIKRLYKTIQSAAGEGIVIGCNTVNHLVAGIHAAQRSGHDTSGRSYEITRAAGGAAMLRLPQNNTFFNLDPDCAAFTNRVPTEPNLDFLELCAITGVTTLASVTPGIIKGADMTRIRKIYRMASEGGRGAVPTDWLCHNVQSKYVMQDGERFDIDWYKTYDGTRMIYTWQN